MQNQAMPPNRHSASSPAQVTGGGDPVDARVARSKAQILSVTLDLLTEQGLGGLSIDEVSRRSGIAKTTIYRHWPTRSALILAACALLTTRLDLPGTGTLRGDLTLLLTDMAALLRSARWSSVLPSIVDAAERDPELAALHSQIQLGHTAALRIVIAQAIDRGELSAETDRDMLIAALLGPLFYRRWFSREALDEAFVLGVIRLALPNS